MRRIYRLFFLSLLVGFVIPASAYNCIPTLSGYLYAAASNSGIAGSIYGNPAASFGCASSGNADYIMSGTVLASPIWYEVASCPSGTSFSNTSYKCEPACAGGTVDVQTNACSCPTGQTLSGGSCSAPTPPAPTCAAGQSVNTTTNQCQPDTPAPTAGTNAPNVGLNVGTCDVAGNCSHNADYQTLVSGASVTLNCGGWECTANATSYSGCYYPSGGGTELCGFTPVYTGQPAAVSAVVPSSSTGSTSNVSAPTVGCPAGYTLDAAGACVQPGTSGTASTATTAGTAPTASTVACPTGYYANSSGACVGAPAQQLGQGTAATCPAGYTLTNGQCVGADVIPGAYGSAAGSGPNSVGSCGGPGQSPCQVSGKLTGNLPATAAPFYTPQAKRTFAASFDDFRGAVSKSDFYQGAIGFFQVSVPGGSCTGMNANIDVQGQSYTFDLDSIFCSSAAQTIYGIMAIAVMIGATYAAYRIAIL